MRWILRPGILAVLVGVLWSSLSCFSRASDAPPPTNTDLASNERVERLHKSLYQRSQSGDAEATTNLATIMEQGDELVSPDLTLAYNLYEPAAKLGNPIAIKKMCLAYLLGEGRPKDVVKASGFCNKVDAKDAVTYFWGGYDYQYGVTGPTDLESAKASYQEAFIGGSGEAADAIGLMAFAGGHLDAARSWYRKGASLGSADAMAHLAALAEQGQGGVHDEVEARWLYDLAAKRGNATALAWLQTHPGSDTPGARLIDGKAEMTLIHTYGQGTTQKTEPLTVSRLRTIMHTKMYDMVPPGGDNYYYYAYFDCYVGLTREIDLCVTSREYPLGMGIGQILHAVWDGRITLPERDASGNPTAQSHFKFGLNIVSGR